MARFYHVKTFTLGSDVYTTIKSVTINESSTPIVDSGDADTNETVVGAGTSSVSVEISMSDPVQAHAIKTHAIGNLTVVGLVQDGGSGDVTYTVSDFKAFSRSINAAHNAVNGSTVSGRGSAVDVDAGT